MGCGRRWRALVDGKACQGVVGGWDGVIAMDRRWRGFAGEDEGGAAVYAGNGARCAFYSPIGEWMSTQKG